MAEVGLTDQLNDKQELEIDNNTLYPPWAEINFPPGKYFDESTLISTFSGSKCPSIFSLNIQSLHAKFTDF